MATGADSGSEPEPIQTLPPAEGFQSAQPHDLSFPSGPQTLEWEAKVQTWLAGLPARRNATASEMDEWINSNPSSLPESLLPLPRSQLHARILSLHKLLRGSATNQMAGPSNVKYKKTLEWNQKEHYAFISAYAEACRKGHRKGKALDVAGYTMVSDLIKATCGITVSEKAIRSHYVKSKYFMKGWKWLCRYTGLGWDNSRNTFKATPEIWEQFKKERDDKGGGEQPQQPRFVRTDQWMPVYSWLETLETDEVVKSKQITEWLADNPKVKDQLFARHSRYHLMHYIQKLHLKMLRRKEKLKQGSHSIQTTPSPATATIALKARNNVVAVPEIQLPHKSPGDGCKDEELHVSRKNEALLRYELLTDLQIQLAILFAKHKRSSGSKELGSMSLTGRESLEKSQIQPPAPGVGNVISVPGAASSSELKSGKKRKVSTEEIAPVLSYSEASIQPRVECSD